MPQHHYPYRCGGYFVKPLELAQGPTSIIADVCLLILVIPPLALLEWVRGYFDLHGLNAWFVIALEAILAAATLVIVLLLVIRDIRLAYRRLRLPPEEGHDDRP